MAAKRACLAGDYAKGVAILADIYVETKDINSLYNQGRCFEQNGKYEEAIVRFREYQRKNRDAGNPPDPDAERHIAECQALLDPKSAVVAPAPGPTPAPAPPQPQVQAPPPAATPASPPAPAGQPTHGAGIPSSAMPPVASAPPGLDLATQAVPADGAGKSRPVHKTWWFWTGAGVVVAGAATTAILLLGKSGTNVPSSTLGNQGAFQ